MRRLLGLSVAAVLAVSGLLVGGAPATAGAAGQADPLFGAPEVGECYNLTNKQAAGMSTTKAAIDCSRKHTLLIGAVDVVPASVDWEDGEALAKAYQKICNPFWESYYRYEDAQSYLTLLQGFMFLPTEAQYDAGARWVSCEIGVLAGDTLLPLPKGGPAKATKKPAKSIARCATKDYSTVPCSKKHSWRATYAFAVKASGSEKKVEATLKKAATRTCSRKTTGETFLWGRRSIGEKKYAVVCFNRTTR